MSTDMDNTVGDYWFGCRPKGSRDNFKDPRQSAKNVNANASTFETVTLDLSALEDSDMALAA
jgi:hypothetical protein